MTTSYQIDTLKNAVKREIAEGMRLARIVFKTTAEQKARNEEAEDSKACFLPVVSNSFATAFATQHPAIVAEFIESLQDKAIRKVWVTSRRSPTADDLSIEKLAEIAQEESTSDRLTKEQVVAAWKGGLKAQFITYLAKIRNIEPSADNLDMLAGVAENYLPYVCWAVARKPVWGANITATVREKIQAVMVGFMEQTEHPIIVKAVEKLLDAECAKVDETAF